MHIAHPCEQALEGTKEEIMHDPDGSKWMKMGRDSGLKLPDSNIY